MKQDAALLLNIEFLLSLWWTESDTFDSSTFFEPGLCYVMKLHCVILKPSWNGSIFQQLQLTWTTGNKQT